MRRQWCSAFHCEVKSAAQAPYIRSLAPQVSQRASVSGVFARKARCTGRERRDRAACCRACSGLALALTLTSSASRPKSGFQRHDSLCALALEKSSSAFASLHLRFIPSHALSNSSRPPLRCALPLSLLRVVKMRSFTLLVLIALVGASSARLDRRQRRPAPRPSPPRGPPARGPQGPPTGGAPGFPGGRPGFPGAPGHPSVNVPISSSASSTGTPTSSSAPVDGPAPTAGCDVSAFQPSLPAPLAVPAAALTFVTYGTGVQNCASLASVCHDLADLWARHVLGRWQLHGHWRGRRAPGRLVPSGGPDHL
jgi:hypothetical protein